jgi:hypothetical protein
MVTLVPCEGKGNAPRSVRPRVGWGGSRGKRSSGRREFDTAGQDRPNSSSQRTYVSPVSGWPLGESTPPSSAKRATHREVTLKRQGWCVGHMGWAEQLVREGRLCGGVLSHAPPALVSEPLQIGGTTRLIT